MSAIPSPLLHHLRGHDRWSYEGVTVFAANQRPEQTKWQSRNPGARLITRLLKGDLIKADLDGRSRCFRVVKLVPSNGLMWLAEQREAGNLQQRHDDLDDPFRWVFLSFAQLKDRHARKITVDVLGRVHDPGPPA